MLYYLLFFILVILFVIYFFRKEMFIGQYIEDGYMYSNTNNPIIPGFLSNYNKFFVNCFRSIFNRNFCIRNPYIDNNIKNCMCPNGQLGFKKKKFKGKCLCSNNLYGPNYLQHTYYN